MEGRWSNIITAHEGDSACYVWDFTKRRLGKNILRPDGGFRNKLTTAKLNAGKMSARDDGYPTPLSVSVSACGNFGFVGCDDGVVYRYNMQSGIHRGTFPKDSEAPVEDKKAAEIAARAPAPGSVRSLAASMGASTSEKKSAALDSPHDGPIRAVMCDDLNRVLLTGGADGAVRFWNFKTHRLEEEVKLKSAATKMVLSRGCGFFAVASDDFQLRVFSFETRKAVRRFASHTNEITDMCFNREATRLISSSLDGTVRVTIFKLPARSTL